MIKGAIFDMDGTLTDSMHIWSSVGPNYLRSVGCCPRDDVSATVRSMSLYQGACYYRDEYKVPLSAEEIMLGINKIVEELYMTDTVLKPGVKEFVSELYKKNIKLCIATATDRYLVEKLLEKLDILEYFSQIFTCGDIGHGKDEPIIYREAIKFLGTDKSETVIFEDALYALSTAKNDGFLAAAVYDKYEKRPDEMKRLADVYMMDFYDTQEFWYFANKTKQTI